MDYEKLGDNIRNYREQRGFTQEKLAELSNISEKHLSKIERGKINITSTYEKTSPFKRRFFISGLIF